MRYQPSIVDNVGKSWRPRIRNYVVHARASMLYLKNGFKLTEEIKHVMWGVEVNEQRYDLGL